MEVGGPGCKHLHGGAEYIQMVRVSQDWQGGEGGAGAGGVGGVGGMGRDACISCIVFNVK